MYMKLRSFQGNDLIIDVFKVSTAHTHQVELTLVAQIRWRIDMTTEAQVKCCTDFCAWTIVAQISCFLCSMHVAACCTSQVLYTK